MNFLQESAELNSDISNLGRRLQAFGSQLSLARPKSDPTVLATVVLVQEAMKLHLMLSGIHSILEKQIRLPRE